MIIDKPGFYTSKAGKCEVKYADSDFAFGYSADGEAAVWCSDSGRDRDGVINDNITGPWTDKPKPIEGFVPVFAGEAVCAFYADEEIGKRDWPKHRLVHLIEAEDRG